MDVSAILSSRPDSEELVVRKISSERGGSFEVVFETNAWWADSSPVLLRLGLEQSVEAQIGLLPGQSIQRAMIDYDSPLLWDYGPRASIFGNAPLPDPPRFFHEFHELVRGTLGINRDPVGYLNWQGSFLGWRNIVVSRAYQLLSASAPLAEAVAPLLDAQVAEYAILPDPPLEIKGGVVPSCALVLGDSWVLGTSPFASVEGGVS